MKKRLSGALCFLKLLWAALVGTISMASAFGQTNREMPELGRFFDEFKIQGSFVLFDLSSNSYTFYNSNQFRQEFIPASTFKICNSLIGLETGVIPDEHFVLKWDGVKRDFPHWDEDNDLQSAFKYSVVWYYQELARRVGQERMQSWLSKAHYGNEKCGGGIDQFWLRGDLRATPAQQIDFLVRLYKNELPFSRRNMDIVKRIMVAEQTGQYTLRAKTGWAFQNAVGWYVGYVETRGRVYFFATCVQGREDFNRQDFGRSRIEISRKILKELKVLP
jgi:beta-lactamase class D